MYHSTTYFTVSQYGCGDVGISTKDEFIQLRPQDAIELANEIIRQGITVPSPDKPGREITLEEAKKTDTKTKAWELRNRTTPI